MKHYLKLMRVHHYIKNLLVFATIVCSGQLFGIQKLSKVALGFVAFCMISSATAIILSNTILRTSSALVIYPSSTKMAGILVRRRT